MGDLIRTILNLHHLSRLVRISRPIFSASTLTLNLHFSPPFYIGFKGKVKLK